MINRQYRVDTVLVWSLVAACATIPFTARAHVLSGQIRYYASSAPVADVTVQLGGPTPATVLTDANGRFSFAGLPSGNWRITPTRMGGATNGISALDASWALQHALTIRTLNDRQRLACDVTGNATVSALDGARVLQRVLGILPSFQAAQQCSSDWVFVPVAGPIPNQSLTQPTLLTAMCTMGAIDIQNLASDVQNQDFLAILFGDCTGNWSAPTPAATPTPTVTPTASPSLTATRTPTATHTPTIAPTATRTATTAPTQTATAIPVCGNGTREASETCDGLDNAACDGLCLGTCTCPPPACGNQIVESGEACDGSNLGGQSCASLGFSGGTLSCLPTCIGFDSSQCTAPGGLPPDPAAVAPPLDGSVPTDIATSTAFLYMGPNRVQYGLGANTITPARAVVLRGSVVGPTGMALGGVTVTVKDHPEFGRTLTRADGMFDLVVNGGTWLTVDYTKTGYVPAQRQARTEWNEFVWMPDVKMVAYDPQVTQIDLTANVAIQVARGSISMDADGARQATLLIPQGTTAVMERADGSTQPLTSLSVRATEYTVGNDGPMAMPMPLPLSSGYTYALEYSVDEALGARGVRFSQPLYHYVENFLDFPIGMHVPVGYYDRDQVAWVASDDGRVIKILGTSGGLVDIDVDGSGLPANAAARASLGITDPERQRLATLYAPGAELWRVPITHFTPWDCNWPYAPPDDAESPIDDPPVTEDPLDPEDCTNCTGSSIELENQILGERIPIVGTPFALHYSSDRVPGRQTNAKVSIPLAGINLPASTREIRMEVQIAGQRLKQTFPAQAGLSTQYVWDGKDAYGRRMQGRAPAKIRRSYVYTAVYTAPGTFDQSWARFSSVAIAGNSARQEVELGRDTSNTLRNFDARSQGLGAWTINAHHTYDVNGATFYAGDGTRRSAASIPGQVIGTVAGGGNDLSDGVPALLARLNRPFGVVTDAAGNLIVTDLGRNVVRRVNAATGLIATIAGTGAAGYGGDNGPALAASFNAPSAIAIDPAGHLFIADVGNYRVRRLDAGTGIISTYAGNGIAGFTGDGGPATAASFGTLGGLAIDTTGNLLVADSGNQRIRRVDATTGVISTIAGDPTGLLGDGQPAIVTRLYLPIGVVVDHTGNVLVADANDSRVRRIDAMTGIMTTLAGTGFFGTAGDGGPAVAATLRRPKGLAVDAFGNTFIADEIRIRRVDAATGVITTVAGTDRFGFGGDGGPAAAATIWDPYNLFVDPAGTLLFADRSNDRVRRIRSVFGSFGSSIVPDPTGVREAYVFDASGRHVSTRHALTGAELLAFTYGPTNRLLEIRDPNGNVTSIERDASGIPLAIVAPFGQRTTLSLDPNGFLAAVSNPAGETMQMTYTTSGLLTRMEDPLGHPTTMTYDADGRLLTETDAAGGSQTLARTGTSKSYQVTRTTGLGRTMTRQVEELSNGDRRQTDTNPDGTQTVRLVKKDGMQETTFPTGVVDTTVQGPDPRFSMLSPLTSKQTRTTPAGLMLDSTQVRFGILANPFDPLSVLVGTEISTRNGKQGRADFDGPTRAVTTTSPEGRQATSVIDHLGRPLESAAPGVASAITTYDQKGRPIRLAQGVGPNERVISYTYNLDGYVQSTSDPINRILSLDYDAAGRITTQHLPSGRQVEFRYDGGGNLISITPPGRPPHFFEYSETNLVRRYIAPDAGDGPLVTDYSYNGDQQFTKIRRPDGKTIDLTYDGGGRLVGATIARGTYSTAYNLVTGHPSQVTAPDGGTVAYTYDGDLPLTTTWAGAISGSVSRAYDHDRRVSSISVNGTDPITLTYDMDDLVVTAGPLILGRDPQTGFVTGTTLGNVTDVRTYNEFGEVIGYIARYAGTVIYNYTLERDKGRRITRKIESVEGVTDLYEYDYDAAGHLAGVKKNGLVLSSYTYDANGNRLTGPGVASPATYDAQDRVLTYGSIVFTSSVAGEIRTRTNGPQAMTLTYDELGNLLRVQGPTDLEYIVDATNRRLGRKVNGAVVERMVWQGPLEVAASLAADGSVSNRFVYAEGGNIPQYMIDYRSGSPAVLRILADHIGTPRLVVDTTIGSVVQRMDYDEFGNVLLDTNPGFQPFGFGGGLYDRTTKLVRFGSRDYDPQIGRWTTKDPSLFVGGDTNLYAYAGSDPLNRADNNGLDVCVYQKFEGWRHKWVEIGGDPRRTVGGYPIDALWGGPMRIEQPDSATWTYRNKPSTTRVCYAATKRDEDALEAWLGANHTLNEDLKTIASEGKNPEYNFGWNDCRQFADSVVDELVRIEQERERNRRSGPLLER